VLEYHVVVKSKTKRFCKGKKKAPPQCVELSSITCGPRGTWTPGQRIM